MERSDERLSTRDIASPGGGDGGTDRDAALADAPPADTAAVPPDRADRELEDDDDRRFETDRGGDVVTDEPTAGERAGEPTVDEPTIASRQPIADPAAFDEGGAGTTESATGATAAIASDASTGDTAAADRSAEPAQLLPDSGEFQRRWEEIQVRFVDEPRGAVEDADALVATVMKRLAEGFAQERERLESQWGRGEDISTEDLRVALQRYRAFFQRLLST